MTLLVFVVVALASVVAIGVMAVPTPAAAPQAALELSVDAGADRIELTHLAGDALDAEALRLTVQVAGEPLTHQPPVPFFAARGFRSGPTGPFNPAADPRWTAGETASFRVASTNAPTIDSGDRVRVDVYAGTSNGGMRRIASLSATA